MDKTKTDSNFELPPLRRLDDFLLEYARFQIPNFKDLDKWGNRVVNNLLYYQTNYLFMFVIIFLIVGLIHPIKMIVGMLTMVVILGGFAYVSTEGRLIHQFKQQYPGVGILGIILAACFATYTLGSLLVFLLGILLPFSVIFIHASLRLRNIKNKLANKIEGIGLARTPMGIFLEHLAYTVMNLLSELIYLFVMSMIIVLHGRTRHICNILIHFSVMYFNFSLYLSFHLFIRKK